MRATVNGSSCRVGADTQAEAGSTVSFCTADFNVDLLKTEADGVAELSQEAVAAACAAAEAMPFVEQTEIAQVRHVRHVWYIRVVLSC